VAVRKDVFTGFDTDSSNVRSSNPETVANGEQPTFKKRASHEVGTAMRRALGLAGFRDRHARASFVST
jgi:hypothetical protein